MIYKSSIHNSPYKQCVKLTLFKLSCPTSFIVPQPNAHFGTHKIWYSNETYESTNGWNQNRKFLHSNLIYIQSNSTTPPTIQTEFLKNYTNQSCRVFFLTIKKFVRLSYFILHTSYPVKEAKKKKMGWIRNTVDSVKSRRIRPLPQLVNLGPYSNPTSFLLFLLCVSKTACFLSRRPSKCTCLTCSWISYWFIYDTKVASYLNLEKFLFTTWCSWKKKKNLFTSSCSNKGCIFFFSLISFVSYHIIWRTSMSSRCWFSWITSWSCNLWKHGTRHQEGKSFSSI